MKNQIKHILVALALLSTFNLQLSTAFAQGTAFTYQGRLNDGGSPAGGTYNLTFTLFATNVTGVPIAGPVTNSTTVVSNGLFTVMIDFGASAFTGGSNWLEIGVETNGASPFTTLAPRQQLTPVPYAIFANTASNLSGTISSSQLTGTISANQLSGTVSLAQLPAGVITNGAGGVNVSGTFSGNGSGLVNVNGALPWQTVSGTTQQAQPNTGYLLMNNSLVTITLPASLNIGDVVRVSGTGAAGWKIAQNTNQFVSSASLAGNMGTARAFSTNWVSVASSADGTELVAAAVGGQIYTSSDSGATWTARDTSRNWQCVAAGAYGYPLFAAVYGGQIYNSVNYGTNWIASSSGSQNWASVASSAYGNDLVAVVYGGLIYASSDYGQSWAPVHGLVPLANWISVASSADGAKLVAVAFGGQIYTSSDYGFTWTNRDSGRYWESVASSTNGTKLVAVVAGGQIYTSSNSGTNWTAQNSGSLNWQAVASSSDGTKLVAAVKGGQIYTSADSGVTWTARESSRNWQSIASSSDGTKIVAVVNGGQIYTSIPNSMTSTTGGTTGYLLGSPNSAIELQYLGNGQFLPISHEGIIQAL